MSLKEDKKIYRDAVMEFRKKHYVSEMEQNLKASQHIRDAVDKENKTHIYSARDRNEAIKTIARMVGGLAPDKTPVASEPTGVQQDNSPLSDSVIEMIGAIINEEES